MSEPGANRSKGTAVTLEFGKRLENLKTWSKPLPLERNYRIPEKVANRPEETGDIENKDKPLERDRYRSKPLGKD